MGKLDKQSKFFHLLISKLFFYTEIFPGATDAEILLALRKLVTENSEWIDEILRTPPEK